MLMYTSVAKVAAHAQRILNRKQIPIKVSASGSYLKFSYEGQEICSPYEVGSILQYYEDEPEEFVGEVLDYIGRNVA